MYWVLTWNSICWLSLMENLKCQIRNTHYKPRVLIFKNDCVCGHFISSEQVYVLASHPLCPSKCVCQGKLTGCIPPMNSRGFWNKHLCSLHDLCLFWKNLGDPHSQRAIYLGDSLAAALSPVSQHSWSAGLWCYRWPIQEDANLKIRFTKCPGNQ